MEITDAYERLCGQKNSHAVNEYRSKNSQSYDDENEYRSFFEMFNDFIVLNFAGFGIYHFPTNFNEFYEFFSKIGESYFFRFKSFYKEINTEKRNTTK